MPIQVQLILPNNLRSSFLRADFINTGNTYFTGQPDSAPTQDSNQTILTFGFQIVDTETRLPVPLGRIVTLQLSNDPQFDPTATVTITNLPFTSAVNPNTDTPQAYQVILDPLYFFGVNGHTLIQSQQAVTGAQYGNGTFIIANWPLSANGGLSTVYFKAVVEAVGGTQGTYPDGYGLYDQIFWQSELPSTPSTPTVITPTAGWTGRRTTWRFRASEESATGRFGTGVSRYVTSLIEVRNGSVISTNSAQPSATRTIATTMSASAMSARSGYIYNSTNSGYSSSGFDVGQNASLSNTSGVALYSGTKIGLSDTSPDFCAQAYVSILSLDANTNVYYQLKIVHTDAPSLGNSADEITITIAVYPSALATATLSRSGSSAIQVTTLPDYATAKLLSGGTLELYVATQNFPLSANNMLVEAFFTPAGQTESFLLADAIVACFPKAFLTLGAAIVAWTTGGTGQCRVSELCEASGRFTLGADAGDCDTDAQSLGSYPATSIAIWDTAALDGKRLTAYTESGPTPSITLPGATSTGFLSLTAPLLTDGRSTVEVEASLPTFSESVRVDFGVEITSGTFYVGLSPVPVNTPTPPGATPLRPMGTRCDISSGIMDVPMNKPTILVEFDLTAGAIFVTQRHGDNTLTRDILAPYAPSFFVNGTQNLEQWSLIVNDLVVSGTADITSITLKQGAEFVGTFHSGRPLTTQERGLGWYVSIGVASDRAFGFLLSENATSNSPTLGAANLYTLSIAPLTPFTRNSSAERRPTLRHFYKATSSSSLNAPLMGQRLLSGATDEASYPFASPDAPAGTSVVPPQKIFAQKLTLKNAGLFLASLTPQLFEVRMRTRRHGAPPSLPLIRFYADANGIDSTHPLTDWISGNAPYSTPQIDTGSIPPFGKTVQFDLSQLGLDQQGATALTVGPGTPFWVAISVPYYCEMACANSGSMTGVTREIFTYADGSDLPSTLRSAPVAPATTGLPILGTGWLVANSLWHKLFTTYVQRHDNVMAGSTLQARLRAESHARISGSASSLSTPVIVDITPPGTAQGGSRPSAIPVTKPTVRATTIKINAADAASGVLAFRVGKETDYGVAQFGEWQSWTAFYDSDLLGVEYTIYDYGTWPNLSALTWGVDLYLKTQNAGGDGARRYWVQVMDGVGNISESYPIQTLAQSVAIVDTVAPTGDIKLVNPQDGSRLQYLTGPSATISINTQDRVSSVMDFRLRQLGSGDQGIWTSWMPITEYVTLPIAAGLGHSTTDNTGAVVTPNGLARVESQFRDYGNNALQESPLWDVLSQSASQGMIFIAMATWTPPGATAPNLYLSAIRLQVMPNLTMVDSQDINHPSGTAFYAVSYNSGSYGRKVALRSTDRLSVRVNGTVVTAYTVDSVRGLLVFNSAPSAGSTLLMDVHRDSALLFQWDGVAVIRLADLGLNGERAILSMCGTSQYLYLGGGTGNLYQYDGNSVTGPIYTASDAGTPLAITMLFQHQFAHETNTVGQPMPYLYLGTAGTQRLFRAPASQASNGAMWARIAGITGSGTITCAASAYNTLFLGSDTGAVLRYKRTPVANSVDFESTTTTIIPETNLGEFDSGARPVQCLCVSGNQVLAGIGGRPEVWSATQTWVDNPLRTEDWAAQVFDMTFANDPTPWQFYSSNSFNSYGGVVISGTNTNSRSAISQVATSTVTSNYISDPNNTRGLRPCLTIQGASGDLVRFSTDIGSDWEQAISNQTAWTLEMDVQNLAGTGRQGFQISDGRYFLDVSLSASDIRLTSGASTARVPFRVDPITAFQVGEPNYPERGVKQIWNFEDNPNYNPPTNQENRGPYVFGETTETSASAEAWKAGAFVIAPQNTQDAGSIFTGSESGVASFTRQYNALLVSPTATGDPVITQANANVLFDTQTKILIRLKVVPSVNATSTYNLNDAFVRVGVSETKTVDTNSVSWTQVSLRQSSGFGTYTLIPSYAGNVASIAVEFSGLPIGINRPSAIQIDYIAIVSDSSGISIRDNMVPVRIAVSGQDVKVWVGKNETPLVNAPSFLVLPTTQSRLSFGKITNEGTNEAASTWNWGGVRFYIGAALPPVVMDVQDFALSWRFPSSGGVRQIVNYQGTAWALTDGFLTVHNYDNLDDHAVKAFSYHPDQQVWTPEAPPIPRNPGGTGAVRPMAALTFNGTLVVSGQTGDLRTHIG